MEKLRLGLGSAVLAALLCGSPGRLGGAPADAIPYELYVVPFSSSSARAAEMVLAQTFQGLTGASLPRLWLDKPGVMSAVILQQLENEGTVIHRLDSVWDLPSEFWRGVDGAIIYNLGTHSLNTAISLCAPLNAVAVDETILEPAYAHGLTVVHDARGESEDQIFDQYFEQFTRGIAVEQADNKPHYLRDFAVLNHAFTFFGFDSTFRRQVAAALGPGATFYGWTGSEFGWISDLSRSGGEGVAADFCVNLSALSRLPVEIPSRAHPPPAPAEAGQRILAFVLSDGDNIQWETGGMPLDSKYYASAWRGQFNMNWEVSPLLAGVAPRVLKYFIDNATDLDGFVAAGAPGYRYIHFEPEPRGEIDAAQTAAYLDASHLSIVSVINDNGGSLAETIPLLDLSQTDGVIYKAYAPYNRLHGQMLWRGCKPAVSYKFLLWEGAGHPVDNPQGVAAAVAQMPSSPRDDEGSYALVNVHAWSFSSIGGPLESVKQTIDLLPPNTRVVSIDDFFTLLKQNLGCGS